MTLEFEFNQQDKDLVISQNTGIFSENDYIRLTIYPTEAIDNIVDLPNSTNGIDGKAIFFSTLSELDTGYSVNVSPFKENNQFETKLIGGLFGTNILNDFKIYKNGDNVYIKPNEIFNKFELPQGDYRIQIDFLSQVTKGQVGGNLPVPYWFEDFDTNNDGILNILDFQEWSGDASRPDIAHMLQTMLDEEGQIIFNIGDAGAPPSFYAEIEDEAGPGAGPGDNEQSQPDPQGAQYYYLSNFIQDEPIHYQFLVKQISTSRKEVRLKILNEDIFNNSETIKNLTDELNFGQNEFLDDGVTPNPNYKYQFKHILNIGNGDHVPIMNYAFDDVTDGKNNQSIILKLYEPLPSNISNLKMVTIEREVLTTQLQDIFYFSDVPDVFFGDGLIPDTQQNWINPDNNDIGFQNLNELVYSASIGDIEINSLISSSQYDYPNLNTDFNEFSNHTFFGSAKKKLQNFNNKVKTIQGYYSEISSSLNVSSSINGDSTYIIEKRKNLFNKINNEFITFTPYERFLYFDGQTDSTASAPSLKNYADTIPVTFSGEGIELNQHNGFNVVYKHSSEKVSGLHNQYIDLFTDKYKVENKPFFNYSSSIYLSFLLQGDSGSLLSWENRNQNSTPSLPHDTLYQNNILNPNMTGSEYQRYIFQASQSYFVPNTIDNDMADLSYDDFTSGSSKITILSGSVKTGSVSIKDSTGLYPTTAVSSSVGVPFKGSIMPSGELFRIFYKNNLSASLFAHYNYENITIDDRDFEVLDVSGNNRTISWEGGGTDSFTSASVETGVDGKISSSLKWSGSNAGASGLFYFNSNIDNEAGRVTFTTSSGVDQGFDGFTFTSWLKTEDTNITIMSLDIKSSGSGLRDNVAVNHSSLDDVDGWWVGKSGASIQGQVTDQGHKVLNKSDFAANPGHADLTDNEFHHYALSWNQTTGTGSLYIDGVNVKTLAGYPLSGSNVIYRIRVGNGPGSALGYGDGQFDETRFYLRSLNDSEINQLFLHPDGKTETKITDVKLTLKDPTNVLPFDNLFHTSSTEWTNWYNDMLTKAETFDTDNIHSFENNLPLYIQESSEYNDMKDFLNLQGEQYDLIRNHIDSMGTLHKRGYKKTNSPPNNTLPMLLSNMGWQAINPFSGSLTDSLGSYLSGVTSIDDIRNNTWRKTLNNLIYIYKSKGTKNSVRALLNTYGYPPDVLKFQEFGGATSTGDNNTVINDAPPQPIQSQDTNFNHESGSISFVSSRKKLYRYMFNSNQDRVLNLDWWMDSANINTLEFVYKHKKTTQTQTILKSSGSSAQTLWDLKLLPSSDGLSSSFEFRLNNSQRGGTSIDSRGFSMSLAYNEMTDGQLWNIMLQRMTGSTSGPGTIEYRLHSALQDEKIIKTYTYVTMSISGGATGDSTLGGKGFFANQNWQSSGSRNELSSSNLFVGQIFSGSLSEIKGWATPLSISKFRQHTLNKFSTVGNSINSHKDELVYHFKLNENYTTSSISASGQILNIVDSSPTTTYSDYTITRSGDFYTGSIIYGFDIVDSVKLTLQDNNDKPNDNSILINPNKSVFGNLSVNNTGISSLGKKPQFKTSPKLEIYRSPQSFVDNFILDNLSGFNLETLYGNPVNYYSQSYDEFDTFRENFFDAHPIEVNVNTFIRAHENMFNQSIVEGLNFVVPARSTFSGKNSDIGVEIKPTILEKQKYENEKHSVETNPNIRSSSISPSPSLSNSEFIQPKSASISVNVTNTSTYELPKSSSISVNVTNTTTYERPKSGSINTQPTYGGSTVVTSKDGTIDYASRANESYTSVHKNWGTSSSDTHFINYFNTGSDNNYNTYHIDTRFVFNSIGDSEYYSASLNNSGSSVSSDFSDSNRFYNRVMIDTDFHANVTYQSLIGGSGSDSNHTGRMLGKTRYFITSSDGTITLPRNHVTKFSQPFKDRMYQGTQNPRSGSTDAGQLNVQYEDYSTASFYSVTVTGGENTLRVNSGKPSKGDDKIIYGP